MSAGTKSGREEAYLYLAAISIAAAFAAFFVGHSIAEYVKHKTGYEIPIAASWFLELGSPIFIYGLLTHFFEHTLWKHPISRRLRFSALPDIGGTWNAEFRSSFDKYQTVFPARVTISQTWSSIGVTLVAENSRSTSEVAEVVRDGSGQYWLVYTYLNEPLPTSTGTMHAHRGSCRLAIKDDSIEGEYYTGRGRNTDGTLKFTRE